uniref:Uncharacterized protein n=1 Tax=Anguilla anguilla TaxID=7936 RepID=A0A0E9W451_ANGAN
MLLDCVPNNVEMTIMPVQQILSILQRGWKFIPVPVLGQGSHQK